MSDADDTDDEVEAFRNMFGAGAAATGRDASRNPSHAAFAPSSRTSRAGQMEQHQSFVERSLDEVNDLDVLSTVWKQTPANVASVWGGRGQGGRGVRASLSENVKDVRVHNISLAYGGKELLSGADLLLLRGRRYGVLGNNGCGKTTFFRRIASGSLPGFPRHLRTLLIDQELVGGASSLIDEVLAGDSRRARLRSEADELESKLLRPDLSKKAMHDVSAKLAAVLEEHESYDVAEARRRARGLLAELGFTEDMLEKRIEQLSGGWRMRVFLAKAIFGRPDVLILDEPTNHLDLDAVSWLERQLLGLQDSEIITVIVSHDRAFVDVVATDIIEFTGSKLVLWPMDFQSYITAKQQRAVNHEHQVDKLEKKRDQAIQAASHMERSTRGKRGDQKKSSQVAQKRLKAKQMGFEKTEDGAKWKLSTMGHREYSLVHVYGQSVHQLGAESLALAAAAMFDHVGGLAPFRVRFHEPTPLGQPDSPVIRLENACFTYPGASKPVLTALNMTLRFGQRIALLGPNGHGKSTLLNLLRGAVEPSFGQLIVQPGAKVAHFSQHSVAALPADKSALSYLSELFPTSKELELRSLLGSYGLRGDLASCPIGKLSGGQKARIVFAHVSNMRPHVLLLDEPSNHLDMATIGYLSEALTTFKGLVVLVSHNRDLVSSLGRDAELWEVCRCRAARFLGGIDEFRTAARTQMAGGAIAARGLEITPITQRRNLDSAGFAT